MTFGRCYDSTDPAAIPSGIPLPDYALGYVDGKWPTYHAMDALYPTAIPVSISAIPGSGIPAQGCDGEQGDYDPAQAAAFALSHLVQGATPFIYCSFANWHDYQIACSQHSVDPNEVDWFIAAYPGIGPVPYPGSIGHQWIDHGTYDESAIVPGWIPGRPSQAQHPTEETDVPVSPALTFKPGQADVFQIAGGVLYHKFLITFNNTPTWFSEQLCGPNSVIAVTRGLTLPDQTPQTSIIGDQMTVTAEDAGGHAWYWAETRTSDTWGVNELP